jgi:glycosyltransferase involved in cell wall biosynthesis
MIYGVAVTYNDWPYIRDMVRSIHDKVDELVVIDGKYADFPQMNGSDFSSDGTVEWLMELDKVHLLFSANVSEVEKRNQYLVGDRDDWYLHLDSDEVWNTELVLPKADMLISNMTVKPAPGRAFPMMKRVRLFRHVPGLHYDQKHYWLKDGRGRTFALKDRAGADYKAQLSRSVDIVHNEYVQTEERFNLKRRYYKTLYKFESRIREEV